MTPTTKSILNSVKSDLEANRKKIGNYMYYGDKALESEDFAACLRVMDYINRTLDLL